jgi:hypothetical protein
MRDTIEYHQTACYHVMITYQVSVGKKGFEIQWYFIL